MLCLRHSSMLVQWDLTFDMGGGLGPAQLAQGRPLDGGIGFLLAESSSAHRSNVGK